MPQKRQVERSENITSLIKGIRDSNKIKKMNKYFIYWIYWILCAIMKFIESKGIQFVCIPLIASAGPGDGAGCIHNEFLASISRMSFR